MFEFNVPFNPGRNFRVGQVVQESDISIILKRVVIAQSGTRFTVCFAELDPTYEWIPLLTLKTPKINIDDESKVLSDGRWLNDQCSQEDFGVPMEEHLLGEWTLTVTELVGESLDPAFQQVRLRGIWQFEVLIA